MKNMKKTMVTHFLLYNCAIIQRYFITLLDFRLTNNDNTHSNRRTNRTELNRQKNKRTKGTRAGKKLMSLMFLCQINKELM